MTEQKTISLSRGELTLRYQTTADYQLDDLLGFAERINPKRAFLFVSKVLGRHIPVSPDKMRQAFTQLATLIPDDLPEPIVVIGMAETAVGLSAGVHQVLQARYPQAILLNSTRHAQAAELLATFSEDHSHASVHLIYQSDDSELQANVENAKTLIMVDDEASTGNTCQNVVNALRQAGMSKLEQVHLATLVDWSLGKKLGKKVILVGTSTGGTLALQLAAAYPEINSLVLLSPNIAINDDKVWLLNDPWGLQIARLVSDGNERFLAGKTANYKKYWYSHYRLESVVQLQELLESSMNKQLFEQVKQPTLLLYYYKNEAAQDPVVKVSAMLKMFDELGTPAAKKEKLALPNTGNHVIGSYITSKDIPSVEKAMNEFARKHIFSK